MTMTNANQYTHVARVLHWLIAGMIVVQFVLANLAEETDSKLQQLILLANHKSVGITILLLAIARFGWRLKNPAPALPEGMAQWQRIASQVSHYSLYALLIVLPLSGWMMSSASAYPVSWFNLVQLPDLVAADPAMKERFEALHGALAWLLFLLAAIHIAAAIKHAVIDRDGLLRRISSAASLTLFVIVIVLGVGLLTGCAPAQAAEPANDTASVDVDPLAGALPDWQIDYDSSHIRFRAVQAGAEFEGAWPRWNAAMQFDDDELGMSRFDVTVMTGIVDTQDADRDATLQDPEWFDSANYPEARFRATEFRATDDGQFAADGELTIKQTTAAVTLVFGVEESAGRRLLTGTATLDRLALNVGTGEWTDTTWIGQEVIVEVRVEATFPDE